MVGIFSRFSASRTGHRRTQSALDERGAVSRNSEATTAGGSVRASGVAASHGIEAAIEFKPVEHPTEPLDNDQPIQCPLPEPSILNDGRIWKERVQRRNDVPVMQEKNPAAEPENNGPKPKPRPQTNRVILPSISAPEHNILKLLEECNASGM